MTNSKNKYNNEDSRHVQDDCVEGDTVSEGDTSDEEDLDASRMKNSKRSSSSLSNKQGLELPSGNADDLASAKRNRKKPFLVLFAIAAVVAISVVVGVGIKASRTTTVPPATTTTVDNKTTGTSESLLPNDNQGSVADVNQKEEEDQNNAPDSDPQNISKGDTIAILDELIGSNESIEESEDKSESVENEKEKESRPTKWPELVGLSGSEAKEQLELIYGEETYDIYVLHEHDPTTRDYRFNRIRIFTNDEGIVTSVPHIG